MPILCRLEIYKRLNFIPLGESLIAVSRLEFAIESRQLARPNAGLSLKTIPEDGSRHSPALHRPTPEVYQSGIRLQRKPIRMRGKWKEALGREIRRRSPIVATRIPGVALLRS
jgi:hypothetical protein